VKILTIIGARPQFVKAAVVSRAISSYNEKNPANQIVEVLVHTGQHYDSNMSDVFFQEMRIPVPNYNLGIGGGSHGSMTGKMLEGIEDVLIKEKPDVLLVYGDTNSTLAGALAAVKIHVPVAHVEAGLRSFNMKMPEEINRILTDRISNWLFCPTEVAVANLRSEGISSDSSQSNNSSQFNHSNNSNNFRVLNVGDVMYDAALYYKNIAKPSEMVANLLNDYAQGFYLATVHRAENTDDRARLGGILDSLDKISINKPVILPIHPRTKKMISDYGIKVRNIHLIDPIGYFDMITLLSSCHGVFTDSGGVQKEAYFFHKPCITLREETEWVELVNHGFNKLVGANPELILNAEQAFSKDKLDFSIALYGDGDAGGKIVNHLVSAQ